MKTIDQLRHEVDEVDDQILRLFSKRNSIAKKIAHEKKKHKLTLIDANREEQMNANWMRKAKTYELDKTSIQIIFDEILKMSKQLQKEIMMN